MQSHLLYLHLGYIRPSDHHCPNVILVLQELFSDFLLLALGSPFQVQIVIVPHLLVQPVV